MSDRKRDKPRSNGGVSYWYRETGIPARRSGLGGDEEADVCIVGAGFTGLWTAYYLKRARPELKIVVLEREFAGFGASGRNGGWCSAHFAGSKDAMAKSHGREAVLLLQREMRATVDEVISVASREGIEASIIKSGVLTVARSPAQAKRLHELIEEERGWEAGPDDVDVLEPAALTNRVTVSDARLGMFDPHCARVQPAALVTGLARAVERLGVTIYEGTAVSELRPRQAVTDRGTVKAPTVLRCLEGFTASLEGERRTLLPLNSAMIVTDPLSDAAWDQIGWQGAELLGDWAHAYMYAQRTADGRIALGGRGVPYRFGSATDQWGMSQRSTVQQLVELLHAMFPATVGTQIDHAWCGVLGVRRDWTPAVSFDPETGLGSAGGYVGNGVAATNLAGRVLGDLVLGESTELTTLPWVRPRPRKWEPEPLRYIGVQTVYGLYRAADRQESATGTEDDVWTARLAARISGR